MRRRYVVLAVLVTAAMMWPAAAGAQCVSGYSYGTNRKGIDDFILDVLIESYASEVEDAGGYCHQTVPRSMRTPGQAR